MLYYAAEKRDKFKHEAQRYEAWHKAAERNYRELYNHMTSRRGGNHDYELINKIASAWLTKDWSGMDHMVKRYLKISIKNKPSEV